MENKTFVMTSRGWVTFKDTSYFSENGFERPAWIPMPVRELFREDGDMVIHWDGDVATAIKSSVDSIVSKVEFSPVPKAEDPKYMHVDKVDRIRVIGLVVGMGAFVAGLVIGSLLGTSHED